MKNTKVARAPDFTKNASFVPLVQGYVPSGWGTAGQSCACKETECRDGSQSKEKLTFRTEKPQICYIT